MSASKKYSISTSYNEGSVLFQLPLYDRSYPHSDEVVLGKIYEVSQLGIKVKILNYRMIDAYIALSELSKRRVYQITSELQEGDVVPLLVLRSDAGYVDLSNKSLDSIGEEVRRLEVYFRLCKLFQRWLVTIKNKSRDSYDLKIDEEQWKSVMRSTLWCFGLSETYEKVLGVVSSTITPQEAFPDLTGFEEEDYHIFEKVLSDSIRYESKIKLSLTLQAYGVNAVGTIRSLVASVEDTLRAHGSKVHTTIFAPNYDFVVVDKRKEVIDKIESQAISTIESNLATQKDIEYTLKHELEEPTTTF